MQRNFWRDWWQMVTKTHNVRLVLGIISLLFLITSIVGIVTLDRKTQEVWSNVSIAVLVVIGILYFWHFFIEIPAKIMNEKDAVYEQTKPLRELEQLQKESPQTYVFPSLLRIDASPLLQGKHYITVNYSLSNALLHEAKFTTAKCCLVINSNETTDEIDISVLTIKAHEANMGYKNISLGERISQTVKDKFNKKESMRFKLHITKKCVSKWTHQAAI